jgi:hypothetical protein
LTHDIEAMLEGFALTCLAQGVLDSRFRGNDRTWGVERVSSRPLNIDGADMTKHVPPGIDHAFDTF